MLGNHGDGSEPSGSNGNGNGPVANGSRGSERTLVTSTSNGASKSTAGVLNGSSQNGKEPARPPPPTTYAGHDREEMTRLLIQALSEMGYQEAAASVGRDSGIELENPTVSAFRGAVLEGDWTRAEFLLDGAVFAGGDTGSGGGLILAPNANKNSMRFAMRQQKYLELIQLRDTQRALVTLRNKLTPLCQEQQTLQVLAGLLMCGDSMELMSKAKWDGLQGKSRSELLSQLSQHISPSVMLPEHRLAVLLQQVKTHQLSNCVWHTNPDPPSLYADHHCDRHAFPTETALALTAQTGEVWRVVFSHDGTKMASCGSEDFVIIWDVPSFEVLHKLTVSGTMDSHLEEDWNGASGVGNITWSPDDSMIVTCGRDHHAKIWNVETGTLKTQFKPFSEPVTCCVWAPNGREIILGTLGLSEGLCQWSLEGELVYTWTKDHRIEDMAISPDGRWLVAVAFKSRLLIYSYPTRELQGELDLGVRPTSISICEESRYLLVNKQDDGMSLIDLANRETRVRYTGHKGGEYSIRGNFGGANESYVVSGSEDGYIFIWHKWTGFQIKKLFGHAPRANAVSWNPKDPCMFASCGDDGKIKIWSNHEFAGRLRSQRPNDAANGHGTPPVDT